MSLEQVFEQVFKFHTLHQTQRLRDTVHISGVDSKKIEILYNFCIFHLQGAFSATKILAIHKSISTHLIRCKYSICYIYVLEMLKALTNESTIRKMFLCPT